MMRKITLLLLLSGTFTLVVRAQEKGYYLGHNTLSLQASASLFGLQANYQYIVNPKARFMWLGRAGIGMSLYEAAYGNYRVYYSAGIDMAYGRRHRLVLGLGGAYNAGVTGAKDITGDIGYLLLGKKHLFFAVTIRVNYETTCDCRPEFDGFSTDLLFSLGWAF